MKTNKYETYSMLGIALLVIAGIFIAIAFSQPRVYVYSSKSGVTATVERRQVSNSETKNTSGGNTGLVVDYPLDINKATLEELMTIDGLGEKKASAIIEYREYLGKFSNLEQLMEIEGFGEETYKAIAGYLKV